VVSNIFGIFTPKIGEDEPILTSIFFKWVGSNHQPEFFGVAQPCQLYDLLWVLVFCFLPTTKMQALCFFHLQGMVNNFISSCRSWHAPGNRKGKSLTNQTISFVAFMLQGSWNETHIGGMEQCKSMVIFGGLALKITLFVLVIQWPLCWVLEL